MLKNFCGNLNVLRGMIDHNAFVYVFQLLSSIAAAIFVARKMDRNINKRKHCTVVEHVSQNLWAKKILQFATKT